MMLKPDQPYPVPSGNTPGERAEAFGAQDAAHDEANGTITDPSPAQLFEHCVGGPMNSSNVDRELLALLVDHWAIGYAAHRLRYMTVTGGAA